MQRTVHLSVLLLIFLVFIFFPSIIMAQENNKFGIHLAQPDPEDLKKAADLVNSNGGSWGYVTLVIQDNDRNTQKWQAVFDQLRELRLIPLIRLATHGEGDAWKPAVSEEADGWASFLNSLNWVVKDRYVILFNEPNHGSEWGSSVDARGYAKVAKAFAQSLKSKSPDYVIMLAGLDTSAPQDLPSFQDAGDYYKTVINEITPDQFNQLFGALSAHSYPNPGFVGSPNDTGRRSIRSYEWELSLLKNLGVKDLPVFITETGWDGSSLSRETVAEYYKSAFQNVWIPDSRVKAITPFILNYQSEPFLNFSWAKLGNNEYYQQFHSVKNLPKKIGQPVIDELGDIVVDLPRDLVEQSTYHFKIQVKNRGQGFWDKDNGYRLLLLGVDPSTYFFNDIHDLKPSVDQEVDLFMKTSRAIGKQTTRIQLLSQDKTVLETNEWHYEVVALPSLRFRAELYPRASTKGDDFEIQLFDDREQLVFKQQNISVEKFEGAIARVSNIILGKKYRVVVLKPYYLPRQTFVKFQKGENKIKFERLFPVDFDKDGAFSLKDVGTIVTNPGLVTLFFP